MRPVNWDLATLSVFSRREASFHLNHIGYAAALTTGCEQKGIGRAASEVYRQVEDGFPAIFTSGTRNDTFSI